ncbi:translation initiation factor IF-2 [bacterium]|nr:translation initiation factor IF-2 [bacterium]
MPKKVIYLVKTLGAKSYDQVVDWLRAVGYDVNADGFGPLAEIDDKTISKLKDVASGKVEVEGPAKRIRRATVEEDADVPEPKLKDFFAAPAAAKEEEAVPVAAPPAPAPRLKPIIPDRPAAKKVKLAKAKKEKEKAPAKAEEAPAKAVAGKAPEAAEKGPEQKIEPEKPAKPVKRPKSRLRRPTRLRRDFLSDDDATVVSRKRVFKVKGTGRKKPAQEVERHLKITRPMTIREVSELTGVRVSNIIRFLMDELSILTGINYTASIDEISLICDKFGIDCEVAPADQPEQDLEIFAQADEKELELRPPVVTVMGHVDHGKTKLLDAIRATNVVDEEAGGITQHIGAYQTKLGDKTITFIDTPGHEAFTAMRARGSQVTDLVVLVVAAEDGVMPQTIEAIEHCKSAGVPVIVAINKIDKADANPDRVKQQLSQHGLIPEDWGGDTVVLNVSALTGKGIDDLLAMINLQAELMELKADPTAAPVGVVVENQIDTGVGIIATVLVTQGTFRKGQYILCGESVGRIKRMVDDKGKEVKTAGPAMPVCIIGFEDLPENGEKVYAFKDKKRAQQIAESREAKRDRHAPPRQAAGFSLDDVLAKIRAGEVKELAVVVKADVQGSMEAVTDAVSKIEIEGVRVNVIRSGVGQVNETDVMLASASGAMVIGFNVTVAAQVRKLAEQEKVQVRLYRIIYKLIEDVELAVSGLLEPEIVEVAIGELEIRAIFRTERNAVICGGMVTAGKVVRNSYYRLMRGGELVLDGQLGSLKRFKDDVREVTEGFECGLKIEGTADVQEGDILKLYVKEERAREIVSASASDKGSVEE